MINTLAGPGHPVECPAERAAEGPFKGPVACPEGPIKGPVECIVACAALLGEGPVWDARADCLWWVDIKGRALFRRGANGITEPFATPMRIGAVAPHGAGGLVAATDSGFFRIDPDMQGYTPIAHPESQLPGNRANDGKLDRMGRFWAGTMDDSEGADSGSLYRLAAGRTPERVDSGYKVLNGPAFSPAGDRLYVTDSARRTIFVFDLAADGCITGKRIFAQFGAEDGYPDGMTVDAEGCLWVAFWDGWCLRRIGADGSRMADIAMPVQRPTSCAFGGPDLATLFVTSARIGLDDAALASQPQAGGLFALVPGVRGIADPAFGTAAASQTDKQDDGANR